MRVVPRDNTGAVTFYEVHAPVWQAEAASIGLSPADADAVADAAAAARAAFDRQQQLQSAARAATQTYEAALAQLRAVGAACVAKIRVAATAAGDDGGAVYGRALIAPPDKPGPLPAPGKPTAFDAQLLGNSGLLRLTWRCDNPRGSAGTVYEVHRNDRAAEGRDAFRFLAVVGEKQFVDDTLPAGTLLVEYRVTAVRSTRRGQPACHLVSFGAARAAAA